MIQQSLTMYYLYSGCLLSWHVSLVFPFQEKQCCTSVIKYSMTFYCTESIKIVVRTSTWMLPIWVVCFEKFLVTFFFSAGWIFQETTKEENGEMKGGGGRSRNFCSGLPQKCYCKIINLDAAVTMFSKLWCIKKNKQQNDNKQMKHTCKGRIKSLMAFYDTQGHTFKCYSLLE